MRSGSRRISLPPFVHTGVLDTEGSLLSLCIRSVGFCFDLQLINAYQAFVRPKVEQIE